MPDRWLIVSSCQTFGLTNCLQTLARDLEIDACDYWEYAQAIHSQPDRFARYDLGLVLYEGYQLPVAPDALFRRHLRLPAIEFAGYQPDCSYVMADGVNIDDGVIGPYHSLIALAAYQEGLDAEQAAGWFRAETYERIGYFDQWLVHRDLIVDGFTELGFDIAALFRVTGRGRCFMHTINHPTIEALHEMAKAILRSEDQPMFEDTPPPPDNLAGTWWPVYPEIGERLGVKGSYLFKPVGVNKPMELPEYLERSLACFGRWSPDRLSALPHIEPQLNVLRAMMRGE